MGAPALLLSTVEDAEPELLEVEDAEPELPEVEEGVAMTVLFKGVLDEPAVAVPEVVCEEVTDAVASLTIVVEAVPVVLTGKDAVLEGSIPSPSIVPTE